MEHKRYVKAKKASLFMRLWAYFHTDRWIKVDPRYTRRHPKTKAEIFSFNREERI